MKKSIYDNFSLIIKILTIRLLLDYIYITYLTEKWSYMGFYLEIVMSKNILSYLMICLVTLLLSFYNKNISNLFLFFLVCMLYIPFTLFYGLANTSTLNFVFVTLIFITISFCVVTLRFNINYRKINNKKNFINPFIKYFLLIISSYTLIMMTYYNGSNANIALIYNLSDVYEIREKLKYGLGLEYLFSWQTKVITPFLIGLFYKQNKKIFAFILILSQLWLYIITGHKMILFSTLFALIIISTYKIYKKRDLIKWFINSIIIIQILSILELFIFKNSWLIDNFLRRVFYIPSFLTNYYLQYYNFSNFRFWRDTLFGRILLITDEKEQPSLTVGREFFNSESTNAVTGFIGSEYANAGFLGVFLGSIVIIITLIIIDIFTKEIELDLVLITFLTPIYSLVNSAILTTLLTGGLIIAMLLMMFTKNEDMEKQTIDSH